jgi:hypothetical protein
VKSCECEENGKTRRERPGFGIYLKLPAGFRVYHSSGVRCEPEKIGQIAIFPLANWKLPDYFLPRPQFGAHSPEFGTDMVGSLR